MKSSGRMFIIGVLIVIGCLAVAAFNAFSSEPFINPDLGDPVLFGFVVAGAVTGFIAGYYWRKFTIERGEKEVAD